MKTIKTLLILAVVGFTFSACTPQSIEDEQANSIDINYEVNNTGGDGTEGTGNGD